MKCTSCTTELWGRPAACPVCGTPTGLARRSGRQTPPPWQTTPSAPAPSAPAPSQSSSFFNASDLLDPDALKAVPHAPVSADIFTTGPLPDDAPQEAPPLGTINAADLFDPQVLADLTGSGGNGRGFQNQMEAPAREEYPAHREEPEAGYQEDRASYTQTPSRPAKGPVTPPFFNLTALPTAPPPPPPPPPAFPSRNQIDVPDEMLPPEDTDWRPQRGYRIVSGPPPLGTPSRRQAMLAQADSYEMPAPPVAAPGARGRPKRKRASAPPRTSAHPQKKRRPFLKTLGGFSSLLLVIGIIGGALLFGISRYVQLEALLPTPVPTTPALLPTVAPKTGYTIYPDATLGFSLQYANSWQEQPDKDASDGQYRGDLFKAGLYIGLEVGSSPQYARWSPAQIDDYILGNPFPFTNIPNTQIASAKISVPPSPIIHIANLDWTAEDASITLTNGVGIHMTCLSISHNGRGYAIFYYGDQVIFSNDNTEFFEPMLLSFRFLND